MTADEIIKQFSEEDKTGLLTVREWAESICELHSNLRYVKPSYWDAMVFMHKGKKYNVETVVTHVNDEPYGVQYVMKDKKSWWKRLLSLCCLA